MPVYVRFATHKSLAPTAKEVIKHFGNDLPNTLIITGSGQGGVANLLDNGAVSVPYRELGKDMRHLCDYSEQDGHERVLHMGVINDLRVWIMQGRFHHYEGYFADEIVLLPRTLFALGVERLCIMNAAGISATVHEIEPGSIVLIKSHMSLGVPSSLRGPNDPILGPRHPDVTEHYSYRMMKIAQQTYASQHDGDHLKKGYYCALPGPRYDTLAEVDLLHDRCRLLGMSTIQTVDAARHMGLEGIIGLSSAVNYCTGVNEDEPLSHEEVVRMADTATHDKIIPLLHGLCGRWKQEDDARAAEIVEKMKKGEEIKPPMLQTRKHYELRHQFNWPNG